MYDCKPVGTPIECKIDFDIDEPNVNVKFPYRELIGSLMYLAVLTRHDISFTVGFLRQFNTNHNESHWKCAKRILKYLKGTRNLRLEFNKDDTNLEGFADADWASNVLDRKSYTALSSTEAEYMALSEASKEAIYLRNLLNELTNSTLCVKIFNDNQNA